MVRCFFQETRLFYPPMEMHSLRCTESSPVADTALLLAKALREASPPQSGSCSSGSSHSSTSSEGSSSRRNRDASDESTTTASRRVESRLRLLLPPKPLDAVQEQGIAQRGSESPTRSEIAIPYTEVSTPDGEPWNLANGFPFPCPVLRDPANDGALYIPGEALHFHLNHSARSAFPPARHSLPSAQSGRRSSSLREKKAMKIDAKEKTISLREVIRQVPIRLAHYRDGSFDKSLYDAWLYGDPREPLRDRFARMDRGLRSKFIGLKNSSARVREKVRQKKTTTYKEVAEELVEEIGLADAPDKKSALEAENLKRRVYDVLNVFEAVGLVKKDQKNVYWRGNAMPEERETQQLQSRVDVLKAQLDERRRYLQQIQENYKALYALAERNKQVSEDSEDIKLALPFFLIHAPESTPVDINATCNGRKIEFDFHGHEFSLNGDMWVLRRMQLDNWDPSSPSRFFQSLFATSHSNRIESSPQNGKALPVPSLTQPLHDLTSDSEDGMQPFVQLTPDNEMDVAIKIEETQESYGESLSTSPRSKKRRRPSSSQEDNEEDPMPLDSTT